MITEQDNLAAVNLALSEYARHTSLTAEQSLIKQSNKLGFYLSRRLKRFTPARGSIRSNRKGQGVRLRESLRQKNESYQSLRKRELSLREQGRGYLARASRVRTSGLRKSGRVQHHGKFRQLLAEAGMHFTGDEQTLRIEFGGPSTEIGQVIGMAKFENARALALRDLADDIQVYLDRKLSKN